MKLYCCSSLYFFLNCLVYGCSAPEPVNIAKKNLNQALIIHVKQDKDTLIAGQDYVARISVEGVNPRDCVFVKGRGNLLPFEQNRFVFRRITEATSFDKNGFSKQRVRFQGIINGSGKDTSIFVEQIFWVQRSE